MIPNKAEEEEYFGLVFDFIGCVWTCPGQVIGRMWDFREG